MAGDPVPDRAVEVRHLERSVARAVAIDPRDALEDLGALPDRLAHPNGLPALLPLEPGGERLHERVSRFETFHDQDRAIGHPHDGRRGASKKGMDETPVPS